MKTVKELKNKHRHDTWVDTNGRIWMHIPTRGVSRWSFIAMGRWQELICADMPDHPDESYGPYYRIHKGNQ